LLVACACTAWAQEQKFSTGVDVVTLLATVRDGRVSNSQIHVLEPERRASYTFLDQVLREGQECW
jgi:hypothetical protein